MESNSKERIINHKSRQESYHLAQSGDALGNPLRGREEFSLANEVMDLALEVTEASADLYDLIAEVAKFVQESSNQYRPNQSQEHQRQLADALRFVEATTKAEIHWRLLDSQTVIERPEILASFLEDCLIALVTFRRACESLTEIIGLDGWEKPSATATETLAMIMELLLTCSEKVSNLPGTGLAVSSQSLARTALNLQHQAGRFVDIANHS